jgi:NADPH-dependent 2,4-dienoyl-CoA reductase/sulfur reductase-like enzyme
MMRALGAELDEREPQLSFLFNGETIVARVGETIAAALMAKGIRTLRTTRNDERRGIFCGMGVCHECLVDIEGLPAQRACMTKAAEGMIVTTHVTPARIPKLRSSKLRSPDFPLDPDVLVVGGGAAGLTAAATAAEAGVGVVLIDERPTPGGQYFKQPHGGLPPDKQSSDAQFIEGRKLIARAKAAGVVMLEGMVANAARPSSIIAIWQGRMVAIEPKRLIVAAGAYERGYPIPGWTLPGVMTTGAAQTLLRSYRVLAGRRIVIAGNGPLNLQVAAELKRAGAGLVAIAEAAAQPSIHRARELAAMAATAPQLLRQGFGYLRELRNAGVPLHFASTLKEVRAGPEGQLIAILASGGRQVEVLADAVCMGYGFLPSNELLRLLGCRHEYDQRRRHLVTLRDGNCMTSVSGVYGIGDCCGLSGARIAIAEGTISGVAVAASVLGDRLPDRSPVLDGARRDLRRHERFQQALWSLFSPVSQPDEARAETTICRCEDVVCSELDAIRESGSDNIGSLKRQSRAGMGRCQGRYCVPEAVERLCRRQSVTPGEFSFAAPRPPLKPFPASAFQAADE